MLQQYDRQLVTVRRLARIRPGEDETSSDKGNERQPEPEDANTPEGKRRVMVEHVARELLDNLLFTGSQNPVVAEVRQELDNRLNGHYKFWYPPGEIDVHIVREDSDGRHELTSEERKEVLAVLWEITLAKVDATML
jgi:hypothetical protein